MPQLPLVRLTLFLLLVLFQRVQTSFDLHRLPCHIPGYECCAEPYVKFDLPKLESVLKSDLFGQHLVSPTLVKSLRSHLKDENPRQPLVFIFHGGPGTGKTYVSKTLVNTAFSLGIGSRFVRIFYFGTTFPRTIKETELVEMVHFQIWSIAKTCERSMFVFDGYFPVWIKVLEALRLKDETLYQKTVFVFILDVASDSLFAHVFQEHQKGRAREDLTVNELLDVVKHPLAEATGLFFKYLSFDKLVYVPFLPLMRAHLMQCIQLELTQQNSSSNSEVSEKIAANIVKPDAEFVASGCKRVHEKTLYTLGQHKDEL